MQIPILPFAAQSAAPSGHFEGPNCSQGGFVPQCHCPSKRSYKTTLLLPVLLAPRSSLRASGPGSCKCCSLPKESGKTLMVLLINRSCLSRKGPLRPGDFVRCLEQCRPRLQERCAGTSCSRASMESRSLVHFVGKSPSKRSENALVGEYVNVAPRLSVHVDCLAY